MAEPIRHEGIVESIDEGLVVVRILQVSACASCGARKVCRSSESKERFVDVRTDDAARYVVGQPVAVVGQARLGMKAVRIAFLYPLVLLVAVLAGGASSLGESRAALVALAAVVAYDLVLALFRGKLQREFSFSIESNVESGNKERTNINHQSV